MIQVWHIIVLTILGIVLGWAGMFLYDKFQDVILMYVAGIKQYFKRSDKDKKK